MKKGKVILSIAGAAVCGVAACALLGVLFAPQKGLKTRKNISRKSEDLAEELKDKFNEFLDCVSCKCSDVKKSVSDFVEHGK
ncbi:MAG: YtxH domain-containing protein [Bacteroidota bacterium]